MDFVFSTEDGYAYQLRIYIRKAGACRVEGRAREEAGGGDNGLAGGELG